MKTKYATWLIAVICCLAAAACQGTGGKTGHDETMDELYYRALDSVLDKESHFVDEVIKKGFATAKDSDEYHLYTTLLAKQQLMLTRADSFLATSRRVKAYIDRQGNRQDFPLRRLKSEWLRMMGVYYGRVENQDSAVVYLEKAVGMLEGADSDRKAKLMALINLADIYAVDGQYNQSALVNKRVLALADSLGGEKSLMRTATNGIALAYTLMGDFERSHTWWEKAEKGQSLMPMADRFQYYNNRSMDYYLQHRYEDSRRVLEEVEGLLAGKPEYEWERMFAHINLADVCLKLGDTERAAALLDEAEPFFQKVKAVNPLFYITTQRIELDVKTGRTAEALSLAAKNPIPARMWPSQKVLRLEALELLYEQTGDMKAYTSTNRERQHLVDSINNNNLRMQLSERVMEFQRDSTVVEQQHTIEKKEMTTAWLAALLAAAVLVIALILIIIRQKRRQEKMKEIAMLNQMMELRMKNTRNRITPHFIYNALSHEMLAQMNGQEVNLDTLAQLLRRGSQMADEEATTLTEELTFIDYYVSIEGQALGKLFQYTKHIDDDIDTDDVLLPPMLVQIFVENAIKHGLRGKNPDEPKRLHIGVSRRERGTLVEVSDNGNGISKATEGTGTKVVRQTVSLLNSQNGEQMDYGIEDTGEGCRSWLYLPDNYEYILKHP